MMNQDQILIISRRGVIDYRIQFSALENSPPQFEVPIKLRVLQIYSPPPVHSLEVKKWLTFFPFWQKYIDFAGKLI